jgi:hypothetical protein
MFDSSLDFSQNPYGYLNNTFLKELVKSNTVKPADNGISSGRLFPLQRGSVECKYFEQGSAGLQKIRL